MPFSNDRSQKKGDSGHFYESVEKKESDYLCAGGREAPKFEIFCVITCGLTTHKISIAAPAEGYLYITTRKITWRDVKRDGGTSLETWSGLNVAIMPMSAFSGKENVTKFSTDCLRGGVVAANNITLEG